MNHQVTIKQIHLHGIPNLSSINVTRKVSNSSQDRLKEVLNQIMTEHLNEEEKDSLFQIISEYLSVFHLPNDEPGTTDILSHKIITKDEVPVQSKTYRYTVAHREEVMKQLNDMLNKKITRP